MRAAAVAHHEFDVEDCAAGAGFLSTCEGSEGSHAASALREQRVRDAGRLTSVGDTPYLLWMLRDAHWHRVRAGLVLLLVLIFAGIVIDSLFSASWALDDGLLLAVAAVIALALVRIRGRGRA